MTREKEKAQERHGLHQGAHGGGGVERESGERGSRQAVIVMNISSPVS